MLLLRLFNSHDPFLQRYPRSGQTEQTLLLFGRRNIKSTEAQLRMSSLLSSQIDDLSQHWDMLRAPTFLPSL